MATKWVGFCKSLCLPLSTLDSSSTRRGCLCKSVFASGTGSCRHIQNRCKSNPSRRRRADQRSLAALAQQPDSGLIVLHDAFTIKRRDLVIAQVGRHRIPAVYSLRAFALSGGLISYGADLADPWRQAATYVDRVFKGADPGELPVQQPTKFELVINLRTANALGLATPPSLVATADEVIE